MNIAIVGKGALGLLYGDIAQQTLGTENVCFVMDEQRLARHAGDVYTINGREVTFRDVTPAAFAPASDVALPAPDVVLLAVKSPALASALDIVEDIAGPHTIVIPLLNGITSEQKCAARLGWQRVIGCVSLGMDAARFGSRLEYTNIGWLALGLANDATPSHAFDRACEVLSAAGIPHEVDADINRRLWAKFMANTGVNQVCGAFGLTYGQLLANQTSEAFRTYVGALREVIAVSQPAGINLTEDDLNSYVAMLSTFDQNSMPSLAQDIVNHAPTEVDEFAGEVIRRAEAAGLHVPCNQFLLQRIRELEASYL